MKHIKKYEKINTFIGLSDMEEKSELLKRFKFKIGDYLINIEDTKDKKSIYKIVGIKPESQVPYYIQNIDTKSSYSTNCDKFKVVPEYEVDANKYNI